MLNLDMYSMEELQGMNKKYLKELIITAQEKAEAEYKRAVFWEREARKSDTTLLGAEETRIADLMAVRKEWQKSEDKLVASLNASDIYGEEQANKVEATLACLEVAESQSAYWENTWGDLANQSLKQEAELLTKIAGLQDRVIGFLDR